MKEKVFYSKNYQNILIEMKKCAGRISLYVNGVERDYIVINILKAAFLIKETLSCELENTTVKVVIKASTITVFVDDTQVDFTHFS